MGPSYMPIKVFIAKDYDELSKRATKIIRDAIKNKPNSVLGLATGSTPVGCYRELVRTRRRGSTSQRLLPSTSTSILDYRQPTSKAVDISWMKNSSTM